MAGLGTGAPIVKVYHEKSMILPDVSRVLACLYEKDIEFERCTASYKSLLRLQVPGVSNCSSVRGFDFDLQDHNRFNTIIYTFFMCTLQASSHAPVPFYDGLTFLEGNVSDL